MSDTSKKPIRPQETPSSPWQEAPSSLPVTGAPAELSAPGGARLDAWLAGALDGVSRAEVQRWIQQGAVLVGGKPARASDRPARGEPVVVTPPPPPPSDLQPESIPLTLAYEDDDLLVVDKPAGITVHPGAGISSGTLANALLGHTRELSEVGGEERPGIVHRLDRETSGLLVVARNNAAHRALARQIAEKTAGRQYLAIAWGNPPWNKAQIRAPIGRDPRHRTRMAVVPEDEGGRPAETLVDVEERLPLACVLRAGLKTGRTHQIRVHCAYSGFPLVGDAVYGDTRNRVRAVRDPAIRERLESLRRQALHACCLSFNHPRTGERLEFRSNPPPDWQEILVLVRQA